MKNLLTFILLILCSCNFENKEVPSSDASVETSESKTANTTDKLLETPWKGWQAPSKLKGYSLDALVLDPYQKNGLYSALAVYKQGDLIVRVQIVDGSTDKGKSEIRDHIKIATQNINSDSDYGYEKTLEHNGMKAKEEYMKATGEYLIKFFYKEKYGCSIKANAESSEALWSFVDQLNLDALE